MNPLDSKRELQKESSSKEWKDVTNLSVRKHLHNDSKRIAQKQSESVFESLDIKTNLFGESMDRTIDKARDCREQRVRLRCDSTSWQLFHKAHVWLTENNSWFRIRLEWVDKLDTAVNQRRQGRGDINVHRFGANVLQCYQQQSLDHYYSSFKPDRWHFLQCMHQSRKHHATLGGSCVLTSLLSGYVLSWQTSVFPGFWELKRWSKLAPRSYP